MGYCVFQYHTEISIENVRKSLVDLVRQCLESGEPITQTEFGKKIPRLHYGTYPPRAGKNIKASLYALIWKYSELTGKYCGCQYWSRNAKSVFEQELRKRVKGKSPSLDDAWDVAFSLANMNTDKNQRLVHEHVFPISHLIRLLLQCPRENRTYGWAKEMIESRAIGCVILEGEHCLLPKDIGNCTNPWLRYRGKIGLVDNVSWPPYQRKLIEEADLVQPRLWKFLPSLCRFSNWCRAELQLLSGVFLKKTPHRTTLKTPRKLEDLRNAAGSCRAGFWGLV